MNRLGLPIFIAAALPACLVFILAACTSIGLPGVYMDAVNPDFLVLPLLHRQVVSMDGWYLPGTLLFQRFPVIGQIYHGALPVYLGLPLYALFGTGVEGIRLTHMGFGLMVLLTAAAFMRAFQVRPVIAALCLILLAADPGFLFAFRTQFYITLLPAAPLLLSAAMTERRRFPFLAGLLAGIACYGYFIYLFLLPALALHAWWRGGNRATLRWSLGLLLGVSPYLLGLVLIRIAVGGGHQFLEFLRGTFNVVGAHVPPATLTERLAYFWFLLRGTIIDAGPPAMMVADVLPLTAPTMKLLLLLALPGAALLLSLGRRAPAPGLALTAGMIAGLLALVLTFGTKLWLHHAVFTLPVLVVALAIALEYLAKTVLGRHPFAAALVAALILGPSILASATDQAALFARLEKTGGIGLLSDAINRFATETAADQSRRHMFFPDWGVALPSMMITGGQIPLDRDFNPAKARQALCSGIDAVLVTVAGNPPERLPAWTRDLAWSAPDTAIYAQRNGTPVLTVTSWHAADRNTRSCPD